MLEFNCTHCGAGITVNDDQRSGAVTCISCNTRMRVPDNARQIPDAAILAQAASQERAAIPPQPPKYRSVQILGAIVITIAAILAIVIVIFSFSFPGPEFLLILTYLILPLFLVVAVLALFLLRHIAINIWHIRHKK